MKTVNLKTMNDLLSVIEDIKKKLQLFHNNINSKEAPFEGKQLARNNVPDGNEDCEPYYSRFKSLYSQKFYEICIILKGTSQRALGTESYNKFMKEIESKETERNEAEMHRVNCLDDQDKIQLDGKPNNKKYMFILIVLAVFDLISISTAFGAYYRDNLATSIVMGCMVAFALLGLTHISVVAFRDTKSNKVKAFFLWIVFPFLILVGVMLGILRYLQTINAHTAPSHTSEIILIIISVMVLAFNAALVFFYAPSNDERKRQSQWKVLDKEIKADEKKMKEMKNEIINLEQERDALSEYYIAKRQAQIDFHDLIQHMYQEAISTLILANVRARKSPMPDGFKKKPLPLDLKTDDIQFNNL